jgi:hypothetical protein
VSDYVSVIKKCEVVYCEPLLTALRTTWIVYKHSNLRNDVGHHRCSYALANPVLFFDIHQQLLFVTTPLVQQ